MISLIIPYYRNPNMLERQLKTWANYPPEVRAAFQFIVVDDGSPEPAEPIVSVWNKQGELNVSLYRIEVDIPWNRGGARNLGSKVAAHPWLLHMDIDHVLPAEYAAALVKRLPKLSDNLWYRFRRFRVGAADETRRKDALKPDATFGEVKPHIDSYLMPKDTYWRIGGYDEDYSGCLGGGSPFLKQAEGSAPVQVLQEIALYVYTRHACPDASDLTLSRDTSEYSRRRKWKEEIKQTAAVRPLRFPWKQVL